MITQEVSVSGTVGKQVFEADKPVYLRGYSVYTPTSASTVLIKSGGDNSGVVIHEGQGGLDLPSEYNFPGKGIRFDNGMHVKVLGVGSVAYLYID